MRKMLTSCLVVLSLVLGMLGFAACKPEEPNPGPDGPGPDGPGTQTTKTVTLSESDLTLDLYEGATLTATVKDGEGNILTDEVTWSVEGTAVTVNGGAVQAQGAAGTAVVTAKSGDASASCSVKVEDSGARPSIDLSDEELSLMVGDEYTLEARLLYKRAVQSDAVFEMTVEDTNIATIDNSGHIEALRYGTTTITVKASWRGLDSPFLTETVELTVKENVVTSITSEPATIYTSSLELEGMNFTNTVTLSGTVLIGGKAENADPSKISWRSSDVAVATVTNGGIVTATGDKEGVVDIYLVYTTDSDHYDSEPVKVTVAYPTLDKTELAPIDVEAVGGKTLEKQLSADEIFGAEAKKEIVRIADGADSALDITENTQWLTEKDTGSESARTVPVLVYNDTYAVKRNVLVVTKAIATFDELKKIQEYGKVTHTDSVDGANNFQYHTYGGYFVLADDILFEGSEPFDTPSRALLGSSASIDPNKGFTGVFDGRGHSLVGFNVKSGGIFGDLGGAVIKNLAVVNATITARDGGVLCFSCCNSTIENVFVSFTANYGRSGVLGHYSQGSTLTNVVIYHNSAITVENGDYSGALVDWAPSSFAAANNVYVVQATGMRDALRKLISEGNTTLNGAKIVREEEIGTANFAGIEGDFWTLPEGGMPIFTSAVKGLVLSATQQSGKAGQQIVLTASVQDLAGNPIPAMPQITWRSDKDDTVRVEGGTCELLKEGEADVTATCGDWSAVCHFEVEKATVEVTDKTDGVTLELEVKSATSLKDQLLSAGVAAKLFETFEVDYILEDGKAEKLEDTWLTEKDTGAEEARRHTLIVYGFANAYKVKVLVVTKFISSFDELKNLQEYGGVQEVDAPVAGKHYYNWSGYYILSNDIVVTEEDGEYSMNCMDGISSGAHLVETNGFNGTFDGRGHSIVGLKVGVSGLLGNIGKQGVVKNLALVNVDTVMYVATERHDGIGALATSFAGTIENVFVSVTVNQATSGGLVGRATKGGTIKNTVVYYNMLSSMWACGAVTAWTTSTLTVENVYVVFSKDVAETKRLAVGANSNLKGTIVTYVDDNMAEANFAGIEGDIWTLPEGGMPVFTSAVKGFRLTAEGGEIADGALDVKLGASVTLTAVVENLAGNPIPAMPQVNWNSATQSVLTVEGGVLTLLEAGQSVITATCGSWSATLTVNVSENEISITDKTAELNDIGGALILFVEEKSETPLVEQLHAAGVAAKLFGEEFVIVKVTTDTDTETALTDEWIAEHVTVSNDNIVRTLVIFGTAEAYKVKVAAATKIVRTYDDLVKMPEYAGGFTEIDSDNGNKGYSWGDKCYFVLGNDIVATGSEAPFKQKTLGNISSGGHFTNAMGFHGRFDGYGHTIKGFKFGAGGIFGDFGTGGVVLNTAFVGFTSENEVGVGILGMHVRSAQKSSNSVQNCYFDATVTANNAGVVFGRSSGTTCLNMVVIRANFTSGWSLGAISGWNVKDTRLKNVRVIFAPTSLKTQYKFHGNSAVTTGLDTKNSTGYELFAEQADGSLKKITSVVAQTGNATAVDETNIGYNNVDDEKYFENLNVYTDYMWQMRDGKEPAFKTALALKN